MKRLGTNTNGLNHLLRGILALFFGVALMAPHVAYAQNHLVEDLIPGKPAEARITMRYMGSDEQLHAVKGVEIKLYHVATLTTVGGSATYTLMPKLAPLRIRIEGMTASQSLEAAKALSAAVEAYAVEGRSAITDGEGAANFTGLESGLYLAVQPKAFEDGRVVLQMAPCLWSFPQPKWNEHFKRHTWDYAAEVAPKIADLKPIPPTPTPPPSEKSKKPKVPNVRTGDEGAVKWMIAAFGLGAVTLAGGYWYNKRKNRHGV